MGCGNDLVKALASAAKMVNGSQGGLTRYFPNTEHVRFKSSRVHVFTFLLINGGHSYLCLNTKTFISAMITV